MVLDLAYNHRINGQRWGHRIFCGREERFFGTPTKEEWTYFSSFLFGGFGL